MLDPESSAYAQQSLYKRLGGYDVIAAFVHDLMPRLRAMPSSPCIGRASATTARGAEIS